MKMIYMLNRQLSARFVAAVTLVSLLLSAFPAAFFVAEAATNVFTDGFEPSTNLGNWTVTSGWNSAGDQKHSGTKSAKLAGPSNNNNGGTQIMSKTISTVGYENISVSFWYRASDLEWSQNQGGFDKVEVFYTVDGSTWTEFNQIDGNSVDDNDENNQWNLVTLNLPAPAENNASFALKFDGELGSGNDNVWIDDVAVSGDTIVVVVDTDNDTVPDDADNCPATPNTNQLDTDSDDIGDVCEADTDSDTVNDDIDNCVDTANQDQADADSDDIGDACDPLTDSDQDTVADGVDNCPVTPNTNQLDTDNDGKGDACDDSTDFCPTLDGVQTADVTCPPPTVECEPGEVLVDNQCEPIVIPIDVCPFKPGDQSSLDDCFDLPEDKCPNVPGHQFTNLLCLPPIDWCPLVPGTQTSIFQCFHYDHCPNMPGKQSVHDQCVLPPPVDYCETVEGVQPVDYDCPPPPPVCDEGEIIVDNQCVPETPVCDDGYVLEDNQCVPEPQECVNLLANGSFETEVVVHPDLWDRIVPVTGWTVEQVLGGAPTTLELHRDWSSNEAADGAQYAELDGDHSTKISQSVGLIDGATYELKWAFAPRHDIDASQNQLSVLIDGVEVDTNGPATGLANLTPVDWTQGTYTFVADDTSAVIAFADKGASDSYGTFLDDARLCKIADPVPVATVVAEKVVCDTEAALPNWNDEGGAPAIGENTAQDWVDQSDGRCRFVSDWQFEWGSQNVTDPGDTLVGVAGSGWHTFGPTNGLGKASVFLTEDDLDENSHLWMREVLQEGYIPFTHDAEGNNSDNETAEFYCHTDGLNYDNLDRVDGIAVGNTYHCVAFNAEVPKPAPVCELDVVSSPYTVIDNYNLAVPAWDEHSSWTDNILGATWIWATEFVAEPEESESHSFTETFTVNNPTSAFLDIAADNTYMVYINDILVLDRSDTENNFMDFAVKDDVNVLSYLNPTGENTLRIEVTNLAQPDGNKFTNPAGVLFRLDIDGETGCEITTTPDEPEDIEEDVFRLDGYKFEVVGEASVPKSGWIVYADNLDDEGGVLATTTDESGYYYFDVERGDWKVYEALQSGWQQLQVVQNDTELEDGDFCSFDLDGPDEQEELMYKTLTVDTEPAYVCDFYNQKLEDDDTPEEPVIEDTDDNNRSSGGGTRVKKKAAPQVLGASTSQCSMFLFDYMREGMVNDPWEVKKLQLFLNIVQGNNLEVSGVFDDATDQAVRAFQMKYQSEVLTPWFLAGFVPHQNPTGWVYQLTRWKINNIICPGSEAAPILVP